MKGCEDADMELNVLYGCDENYAPYTGVSMTSLLENNKHLDVIRIYVAAQGFSQHDRRRDIREAAGRGLGEEGHRPG